MYCTTRYQEQSKQLARMEVLSTDQCKTEIMLEGKEETTTCSFKKKNQSTMCHLTMQVFDMLKNTNMIAMPNVWLYE